MIEISVKSKRYRCSITLNQKITIIRGDSGKGKTTLYRAIDDENEAFHISVSDCSYNLVCLHNKDWYDLIDYRISNKKKSIFIIDDSDFIISKKFSHLLSSDKYNFYIIINRFESIDTGSLSRVPFSIKEVYKFVTNGVDHWLEPYYEYEVGDFSSIDYILTEDSGSGYSFFSKFFGSGIESTYGKDKVVSYLQDNIERFRGMSLFLFIDVSGFGSSFELLKEYIDANDLSISFLSNFESFEYLLLSSNMFNYDFTKLTNSDIASESSLEILCESIINRLTSSKPYTYNKHTVINKCYVRNCCCRRGDKQFIACDINQLKGDKLNHLFKGTKFDILYYIRDLFQNVD